MTRQRPSNIARIRALVDACRADGVEVNDRNIVDLVLDNMGEFRTTAEARRAIVAAGYRVAHSPMADDYGHEPEIG